MKNFCIFLAGAASIIINAIFGGFVVSILWGWFITPFFNLVAPSIPMAIGFMVFISCFTPSKKTNEDDEENLVNRWFKGCINSFTTAAFLLLYGWIVQFFI